MTAHANPRSAFARLRMCLRSVGVTLTVCCFAAAAPAATLSVSGGQLLGAFGVDVDGQLYDVEFVDGSCAGIFSGCDDVSDFTFQSDAAASSAAQALLDQVFLDTAEGAFDDDPSLTLGCTLPDVCATMVPFETNGSIVTFVLALNVPAVSPFVDEIMLDPTTRTTIGNDVNAISNFTYATWTLVPEPGTALLLMAGLALVSTRPRRA